MPLEISVVIPAFNEARYLPRLLDDVAEARRRYRRGAESVEVVVPDNGSTDATVSIAAAHGCVIAPVSKRVIAAVRNGGAQPEVINAGYPRTIGGQIAPCRLSAAEYGLILRSMAIPKIKATYSLDTETMRVLERVARRWGVSKSEALRRAIRASASLAPRPDDRTGALDELQAIMTLSPAAASAWARDVRAERRASPGALKTRK